MDYIAAPLGARSSKPLGQNQFWTNPILSLWNLSL